MKLIFGLLLLRTAACLEFHCSFHQSDLCRAALGHKLNLLMVDTSTYKLKILKRIKNNPEDPDCRITNNRIKMNECDLFHNRAEVSVINGTLIINPVIGSDSGIYTLYLDLSDGTVTSRDLQVVVEVSSESSVSVVFVLVWCFQMMFLLGLLGGFHIFMRHTSGKKQEDRQVRMRRFREEHEHSSHL